MPDRSERHLTCSSYFIPVRGGEVGELARLCELLVPTQYLLVNLVDKGIFPFYLAARRTKWCAPGLEKFVAAVARLVSVSIQDTLYALYTIQYQEPTPKYYKYYIVFNFILSPPNCVEKY